MSEKIGEIADEQSNKFSDIIQTIGDAKDQAQEKTLEYVNGVLALSPIIEQIGYKTQSVAMQVGLTPGVIFYFQREKVISEEERNQILAEHADAPMLGYIVQALVATDSYQTKLTGNYFQLSLIEVHVAIPPQAIIHLSPK